MSYRLFIFDFDGTLADSVDWFVTALNESSEKFKFRKIGPDELEHFRGLQNKDVLKLLGVPLWKLPKIGSELKRLAARDSAKIRLFPGTPLLLNGLKGKIAIVSSNSEANIRKILGPELAGLVAHYQCGGSLFGKAAMLKKTLKKLGVSETEAIYIGDEPRDIEAAKNAGMDSGAVSWGYAKREALRSLHPTLEFNDWKQILDAASPQR